MNLLLENATVITPLRTISGGSVYVEGGEVEAVDSSQNLRQMRERAAEVVDLTGKIVVPGFVDVHVHGGGGGDTMDAEFAGLQKLCRHHARGGTTALVPTTLTCEEERMLDAVDNVHRARTGKKTGGATILGAHVEGPFINHRQRGAHEARFIREASDAEVGRLLERAEDICSITAAPEIPGGLRLGARVRDRDIVASAGHSDAYYPDVIRALDAGYRSVTHLFCGMPAWKNERGEKTAGLTEAALFLDDLFVEIIADGNHVSPHLMEFTFRCKGADRICLVTDAIWASGMPPGRYKLAGVYIDVSEESARMADGSGNAGSVATMALNVRNVATKTRVSLQDAVRSATLTPASLMGIQHRKGSLAPGKDADIAVLNERLQVEITIVGGEIVYRREREIGT